MNDVFALGHFCNLFRVGWPDGKVINHTLDILQRLCLDLLGHRHLYDSVFLQLREKEVGLINVFESPSVDLRCDMDNVCES
jgi:hypothetical protein